MMKEFRENPQEAMLHIAQSATRSDGTPFDNKTKKSPRGCTEVLVCGNR